MDKNSFKSLIHAFITSRLGFLNAILYGLSDGLISKLQRVQNAAARLLCGVRKCEHITPALILLHWLPIRQRIVFKIVVLTFKCLHGTAPKYLYDMLHTYTAGRSLRSSNDEFILVIPRVRTKFGERAFSYNAPKLWNSLPYELRSCKSLNTFKVRLKTHLFKIAFA